LSAESESITPPPPDRDVQGASMIVSFRQKLSKLSEGSPFRRRPARPTRRVRLGFYGYRKSRKRSALIARGAVAAALLVATIAAASGHFSR